MSLADDPLFAAILAMDSYNRGNDAGLKASVARMSESDIRGPGGIA